MMKIFHFLLFGGLVFLGLCRVAFAVDCSLPPFVSVSPKPNVLIGFDNSGSMYDLAYNTGEESFCYDTSYNATKTYYGYFENDVIYKSTYDATSLTSTAFEAVDSLPSASSCDNTGATDVYCVQKSEKFFYFTGNFLNWLTMSKLDLIKKSLTGGKYESTNGTLIGQSRGCAGRRFVKEIQGSGFVFGILGSTSKGEGYANLYVGGTTRIEVYDNTDGMFSMGACFDAINEVQNDNPNLGQLSGDTADCVGASKKSNALAAFNHSMQTCWAIENGLGQGDISRIKNQCQSVYQDITDDSGNIRWSEFDPSHSAYVCSDLYIGACYNESEETWGDDECLIEQYNSYCNILDVPEVIDPTTELANTGSFGNVPSILIDSGLVGQLGDPFAVLSTVKAQNQTPEGLLHEFKNSMNLGLMAFNDYGSDYEQTAAEASGYFYENEDTDGAQILSAVQENNQSIITQFNALEAYSWTPIAEMLYEGTRYFGGTDSAYAAGSYSSPISDWCQKNSILFFSDGGSTFDKNVPGTYFSTGAKGQSPVGDSPYSFNIANYLDSSDYQTELEYEGSNYAKGIAWWAHTNDIHFGMEDEQDLDFYTVFALGGPSGGTLLSDIAKYGGFREKDETSGPNRQDEWDLDQDGEPDNFFSISEPSELFTDLKNTFSIIRDRAGSAGSVATVTQEIKGEDLVLRGAFKSYDQTDPNTLIWQGHFENYWPYDATEETELQNQQDCESAGGTWDGSQCQGQIYSFNVHPDQFCSEHNDHCWDAETYLPDFTSRDVFTYLDGAKISFTPSNQNMINHLNLLENDIDFNQNGTVDLQDDKDLVWWIRGDMSYDGVSARDRQGWVLGDIVYSTPVVVGQPSLASVPKDVALQSCDGVTGNQCFFDYRVNMADRMKVAYVGGNDGMLHAFNAGEKNATGSWVHEGGENPNGDGIVIGEEIWAYIPSNLLSELKELARLSYGTDVGCKHRTMVDLSPQVWDVKIDHDNDGDREWRTVLIGGERGGGDLYFALDVTDPKDPAVLWEYSVLRNMVFYDQGNYSYPFLDISSYANVKNWPASWSVPYVGRLDLDGVSFKAFEAVSPMTTSISTQNDLTITTWDASALSEYYAFIPVGIRKFDNSDASLNQAFKPSIMAVDIESGVDILQYVWPKVKAQYTSWTALPQSGNNTIPYAMTSPLVLDIWDQNGNIGTDGYADHLFTGDINGNIYSLKMRLGSEFTEQKGFQVDVRKTKNATATTNSTNVFRSDLQPLTSVPVAAFDPDYNLRIYFGTGKFDNISAGDNDRSDKAKMSFYTFTEDSQVTMNWSAGITDTNLAGTGFAFNANSPCDTSGYAQGCSWVRDCTAEGEGMKPDCCYGSFPCTETGCSSSCWNCVLDFSIPGERVLDSALVAGGLVFFTTYVPFDDPCSNAGMSYIYVLDYLCRPLQENPLEESGLTVDHLSGSQWQEAGQETSATVYRGRLQTSQIPSRPVLDSAGENVLVQTGDAKIHQIPVKLPEEPNYLKGWKEE